jgi:hypothetical protein
MYRVELEALVLYSVNVEVWKLGSWDWRVEVGISCGCGESKGTLGVCSAGSTFVPATLNLLLCTSTSLSCTPDGPSSFPKYFICDVIEQKKNKRASKGQAHGTKILLEARAMPRLAVVLLATRPGSSKIPSVW